MVIVIIGILAAIAIPRFIDLRKEARMAACKGDGEALRAAIANFYAEHALKDWCGSPTHVVLANTESGCWPSACTEAVLGDYVQEWPHSPEYYGQKGTNKTSWNGSEVYYPSTGVLKVEDACDF